MILLDIHHSSRSTVMMLLAVMDPIASRLRKVKRLTRRIYLNMASDQPHVCSYLYLELSVSFQGQTGVGTLMGMTSSNRLASPFMLVLMGK